MIILIEQFLLANIAIYKVTTINYYHHKLLHNVIIKRGYVLFKYLNIATYYMMGTFLYSDIRVLVLNVTEK